MACDTLNNWLGDLPDLDLAEFDDWIKAPDSKQDSKDNGGAQAASTQTAQRFHQDTAQPRQTQQQRSSLSGAMPEWLQSKMSALGNISPSLKADGLQGLPPRASLEGNQEVRGVLCSSGAQGGTVDWDHCQGLSASPNRPDAICNQRTPQQGIPGKQDWRQPPSGAYSTARPSEVLSVLRTDWRQRNRTDCAAQPPALQAQVEPQRNTSGGQNSVGSHPLANTLSPAGQLVFCSARSNGGFSIDWVFTEAYMRLTEDERRGPPYQRLKAEAAKRGLHTLVMRSSTTAGGTFSSFSVPQPRHNHLSPSPPHFAELASNKCAAASIPGPLPVPDSPSNQESVSEQNSALDGSRMEPRNRRKEKEGAQESVVGNASVSGRQQQRSGDTVERSKRVTMQLTPLDDETRANMQSCALIPSLELVCRSKKELSQVLSHLQQRWEKACPSQPWPKGSHALKLFPTAAMPVLAGASWGPPHMPENLTIADLHLAMGYPEVMPLHYRWQYVGIQKEALETGNGAEAELPACGDRSSQKQNSAFTTAKTPASKLLCVSLTSSGGVATEDVQATTEEPDNMAALAAKPRPLNPLKLQPYLHQTGWCDVGSSALQDSVSVCDEAELSQHRRACSAARRLALEQPKFPASPAEPLGCPQGETRSTEQPRPAQMPLPAEPAAQSPQTVGLTGPVANRVPGILALSAGQRSTASKVPGPTSAYCHLLAMPQHRQCAAAPSDNGQVTSEADLREQIQRHTAQSTAGGPKALKAASLCSKEGSAADDRIATSGGSVWCKDQAKALAVPPEPRKPTPQPKERAKPTRKPKKVEDTADKEKVVPKRKRQGDENVLSPQSQPPRCKTAKGKLDSTGGRRRAAAPKPGARTKKKQCSTEENATTGEGRSSDGRQALMPASEGGGEGFAAEDSVAADDGLSLELLAALEVEEPPQPVAARTRRRSGDAAKPPGDGKAARPLESGAVANSDKKDEEKIIPTKPAAKRSGENVVTPSPAKPRKQSKVATQRLKAAAVAAPAAAACSVDLRPAIGKPSEDRTCDGFGAWAEYSRQKRGTKTEQPPCARQLPSQGLQEPNSLGLDRMPDISLGAWDLTMSLPESSRAGGHDAPQQGGKAEEQLLLDLDAFVAGLVPSLDEEELGGPDFCVQDHELFSDLLV